MPQPTGGAPRRGDLTIEDPDGLPPLPAHPVGLPSHRADAVLPDFDPREGPEDQLHLELQLRFDYSDQVTLVDARLATSRYASLLEPRVFSNEMHDATDPDTDPHPPPLTLNTPPPAVRDWRLKHNKIHKTGQGVLAMCINIGTDPPDVVRVTPCAQLLCWTNPQQVPPNKCLDIIGKQLQSSYEQWRKPVKYKPVIDPTFEELRKLCVSARRAAAVNNERVVLHYNGHGVPRPTANNEVWVFNDRYTQYIPLSLYDLHSWIMDPAIYVFDCPGAAKVMDQFRPYQDTPARTLGAAGNQPGAPPPPGVPDPLKNVIMLMACQEDEDLPRNPSLPADVFTAALTTPIKLALRVHAARNAPTYPGNINQLIDDLLAIGKPGDRNTPAGELGWILNAITDTIAWNAVPRDLFHKLYRGDLLVAALFRNFMLAERIMRSEGVTPCTYPRLPHTDCHPLWAEWDRVLDQALQQIPNMVGRAHPLSHWVPSDHFQRHLDQFRNWIGRPPQEPHLHPAPQLPMVLQVFLSPKYRLNALVLFARFLDMGPWAVDLGLSVGAQLYVLKLLASQSRDVHPPLLYIWAKLLAVDPSLQEDIVLHSLQSMAPRPSTAPPLAPPPHAFFLRMLDNDALHTSHRSVAAFALARICDRNADAQELCMKGAGAQHSLLDTCLRLLHAAMLGGAGPGAQELGAWLLHIKCLCMCLGQLLEDQPAFVAQFMFQDGVLMVQQLLLAHGHPEVRAAAVYTLGCCICSLFPATMEAATAADSLQRYLLAQGLPLTYYAEEELLCARRLFDSVKDASVAVRCELAAALARLVSGHMPQFLRAVGVRLAAMEAARGGVGLAEGAGGLGTGGVEMAGGWAGVEDAAGAAEDHLPFYNSALEVVMQLATDPAPRVARLGRKALALAGCTVLTPPLRPAAPSPPPQSPRNYHPSPAPSTSSVTSSSATSTSTPGPYPPLHPHPSHPPTINSITSKLKSTCSWVPGFSSSSSRSSPTPSPTPPQSPSHAPPANFTRGPHLLAYAPPPGHHSALHAPPPHRPRPPPDLDALPPRPDDFPESTLCTHLVHVISRPLFRPTTTHWRDLDAPPWIRCPDLARVDYRVRTVENSIAASRAMQQPRMKEPYSVSLRPPPTTPPTKALPLTALSFHHFHSLITGADLNGMVHVHDYTKNSPSINVFHAATGAPSPPPGPPNPPVVALFQVNEAYTRLPQSTLMACTADGGVHVWRNYAAPLNSRTAEPMRLATAFQAVPVPAYPTAAKHPAAFAWSSEPMLYAAGGALPSVVHCWDAVQERCTRQIMPRYLDRPLADAAALDRLALNSDKSLLLSTAVDGTVHVYDVRLHEPEVFRFAHDRSDPLCGALLEPCSQDRVVVLGTVHGDLQFLDLRAASAGDVVTQVVTAHSTGRMCHIASHMHAPIISTGTSDGAVKVWNATALADSSYRVKARDQPNRPVAFMAFHPQEPFLAVSDAQPGLTVYVFEEGAAARPASSLTRSASSNSTASSATS